MHEHAGIPLSIAGDNAARATGYDGERLRFVAAKAFPPGQPLTMSLQLSAAAPLALAARCLGSKRRADGQFDVQARLVNLDRSARDALNVAFVKDEP